MTDQQILHWFHHSHGIEKEIVADYLYENNRTQESNIVRAIGQIEQGKSVKTKAHYITTTQLHDYPYDYFTKISSYYALSETGVLINILNNREVDSQIVNFDVGYNKLITLNQNNQITYTTLTSTNIKRNFNSKIVDVKCTASGFMALDENNVGYYWNQHNQQSFTDVISLSHNASGYQFLNKNKSFINFNEIHPTHVRHFFQIKGDHPIQIVNNSFNSKINVLLANGTVESSFNTPDNIIQISSGFDFLLTLKLDGSINLFGTPYLNHHFHNVIQIHAIHQVISLLTLQE